MFDGVVILLLALLVVGLIGYLALTIYRKFKEKIGKERLTAIETKSIYLPFIVFISLVIVPFFRYNGAGEIQKIWNRLFPDERWIKTMCMYPEERGHLQTINDYKYCLEKNNVKITVTDTRKMCYLQAQEENYRNSDKPVNDYYLECVRSEGLPN